MNPSDPIPLKRDVQAAIVPVGTPVTLLQGENAYITQSLGGSYTVIVNGNMFRIDSRDADALGFDAPSKTPATPKAPGESRALETVQSEVWNQLKTCYDPEIPVNIVDLGLIYDCQLAPAPGRPSSYHANVKMTLTAPGCGMGPMLAQDVQNKLLMIEEIDEANVELVWDPPWNQGMMTEAARLQLGLM